MTLFTIRIDILIDEYEEVFDKFCIEHHRLFEKTMIFYEVSKEVHKKHYQGIMDMKKDINVSKEIPKMRVWISRNFKVSGSKKQYSIAKVKDQEKYEDYIAKDGECVYSSGYYDPASVIERSAKRHAERTQAVKTAKKPPFYKVVLERCIANRQNFWTPCIKDERSIADWFSTTERQKVPLQFNPDKLRDYIVEQYSTDIEQFNPFIIDKTFWLVYSRFNLSGSQKWIADALRDKLPMCQHAELLEDDPFMV